MARKANQDSTPTAGDPPSQPPTDSDALEAAKAAAVAQPPADQPPPAPPPQDVPPQPIAPKFKVKEYKRVSLNGVITEVRAGQIISTDGYAPATIDAMKKQGVVLEPL